MTKEKILALPNEKQDKLVFGGALWYPFDTALEDGGYAKAEQIWVIGKWPVCERLNAFAETFRLMSLPENTKVGMTLWGIEPGIPNRKPYKLTGTSNGQKN